MHPLDGAFLKLKRANYHLQTLQQSIEDWRSQSPYRVVGHTIRENDVVKYRVTVQEILPIRPEFSLMVGDVCNNARSVLDHVLWQLWLLIDPVFDKIVSFPILDSEMSSEQFNHRQKTHIGKLTAGQRRLIEGVQPYITGDSSLSVLRDLNNSDKHRVIQVFAMNAGTEIFEIKTPGGGKPTVGKIRYRYAERVEVKQGAMVAELTFPPDFIGDELTVETSFGFTMAFRNSKTANGLNVDAALQDGITAVHDVLLKFEGEFPGTSAERI